MGCRVKTNPFRATLIGLFAVSGCIADPVEWGDVSYRGSKLGDPDARSAVMSANLPTVAGTVSPCLRSIRHTGSSTDLFRVWWSARNDSSALLTVQHSSNRGTSWDSAVVVDARDRGRNGCDRPPPGIFFDPASSYLHVVYFLDGVDGAGVFFSHSMDKGAMFHAPVAVVYGKRPSSANVAGHSDSIVVVFEDPNATTPRIGLVLSRSAGHIFEQRTEATPDDVPARAPWVEIRGKQITVWWKSASASETPSGDRVGYRTGIWK